MAQSAKRLTAFARTMEYFRTADQDEAEAALVAAQSIVHSRSQPPSAPTPPRRRRRTKAELAAAHTEEGMTANG